MKVNRLKKGTKLVWDAVGNMGQRIVDPVTVGIRFHSDVYPRSEWRTLHFPSTSHWMGPEVKQLREPTDDELNTMTWPEATFSN